jgi:Tfp pilus assembly protein PilV
MALPSLRTSASPLREQSGFALVEVLTAIVVIAVGIIGLIAAFDSSRKLTLLSEQRTAMAHRAQLELERLQTYPYAQLAMITAPAHSAEKTNPDYYVNTAPVKCTSVGDGCYAWNAESTGEEEPLVPAKEAKECVATTEKECGVAAASPTGRKCSEKVGACEWSDGLIEGKVYDFVTWHVDGHCGSCAAKENYKRITVVVTAKVSGAVHEPAQVHVSSLITEPS